MTSLDRRMQGGEEKANNGKEHPHLRGGEWRSGREVNKAGSGKDDSKGTQPQQSVTMIREATQKRGLKRK